jgi:hypothetical protein
MSPPIYFPFCPEGAEMFQPAIPHDDPHLLSLLSHYARLGCEDPEAWQDRVMSLDGLEPERLTLLHGELIAADWVEQNTGRAFFRADGTLAACYRATHKGLREYRRLHGVEEQAPGEEEPKLPKAPRKKRGKDAPEPAATSE